LARIEAVHPTEPHYYLAVVGVEPAWQGQGLGSALMQPALQRCDAEGVGAYLEASTRMSRALYERHGFSVIDEVRLPEGPPLWPMWREPRTG
jgi:GNAT superfamily N-acetyltransferase